VRNFVRLIVIAAACACLAGCDNPERTVARLRVQIADYKAAPTDAKQEEIEAGFDKLGSQIAKLESDGSELEASALRSTAENLKSDYRAARIVRSLKDAQSALEGVGNAFKEAGKSISDAFKDAGGD